MLLGIEVSNLFDCVVTPEGGEERCDESDVVARLDEYWARGVRVLFPNHKTDNLFTPGDGSRGVFELANFVETGHWSNFTDEDCPDIEPKFDGGGLEFADGNEPRDDYLAPAPNDVSDFVLDPVRFLFRYIDRALPRRVEGDYCQNAGLTPLGRFLIGELMRRGMVIEIDHLPRRSYVEAFELIAEQEYPAIGTHGRTYDGRIYTHGGLSVSGFDRCQRGSGSRAANRQARARLLADAGWLPSEPMSFDWNGLAGLPDGRFSPEDPCSQPQSDPVTYPFTSYAGDVTFTAPQLGERAVDFNAEGLVHIGLLPELVEDLRSDPEAEQALESLFLSAEAYLRMWERAEARGAAIAGADE